MTRDIFEKGSALFIILIAVALFGALAFAVSNMMKGGNPSIISEEKSRLYADEILGYSRSLRQAVQNVKISNGCLDTDISFENSEVAGYEHTPAARDACKIFNQAGGGMTYIKPINEALDVQHSTQPLYGNLWFPEDTCVTLVGGETSGDCSGDSVDNEELIVFYPYIRREVCIQINKKLNITNPGGNPPTENAAAWTATKFTGSFADGAELEQDKRMNGCFTAGGSNPSSGFHYFQVLSAR